MMTSKQRVLSAMKCQEVDHAPCSPWYNPLYPEQRVGHEYQFPWGPSELEMAEYNVKMLGVDPVLDLDVERYEAAPGVTSRTWLDGAVLHKTYTTPAGELHAAVRYNILWPHGMNIPFFSDFNVGHYVEPWIQTIRDLECLKHLFVPVQSAEGMDRMIFDNNRIHSLADQYELATVANVGRGLTGAMHLFGAEGVCIAAVEDPELLEGYLEFEHQLNLHFIQSAISLGADIIVRNGFYETCDFYSPRMLESYLYRRLTEEIDLAHRGGKLIGYVLNTGVMPMLDYLAKLEFDCIMNLDISFQDVDVNKIHEKLGGNKSFWLGPSGTYDIAEGSTEDVRNAVRKAFAVFGKKGLIITACPSSHSIMPWENTLAMIDEWKKLR